jgi:hypothetical protein
MIRIKNRISDLEDAEDSGRRRSACADQIELDAGRGEAGDADAHPEHEEVEVVHHQARPTNVLA